MTAKSQRAAGGVKAAFQVIMNGLMRAARTIFLVGVDGTSRP